VGSSLSVQPAAGLVRVAAEAGARIVDHNASPTPYDRVADALIRERSAPVLPALDRRGTGGPDGHGGSLGTLLARS